jgi:hypothetical protein
VHSRSVIIAAMNYRLKNSKLFYRHVRGPHVAQQRLFDSMQICAGHILLPGNIFSHGSCFGARVEKTRATSSLNIFPGRGIW